MLRPGVHTQAHRQTGSAVYLAFEGHGATIINGVEFEWAKGDMFVVPSWAVHEHINWSGDERAILFSIQDTPLLKAVNKYREEAYTENGGRQVISGVFDPSR
jgi:gentisate 1,2-dioxygenase